MGLTDRPRTILRGRLRQVNERWGRDCERKCGRPRPVYGDLPIITNPDIQWSAAAVQSSGDVVADVCPSAFGSAGVQLLRSRHCRRL